MSILSRVFIGAASAAAVGLSIARLADRQTIRGLERALRADRSTRSFQPELLPDLPSAARRYLEHAIAPGTLLPTSADLHMRARMRPRVESDFVDLEADEILAPPVGFLWTARGQMGRIPIRVRDHYYLGAGGVAVRAFSVVPVAGERSPDVARSSRHRTAGESIWVPSSLLPTSFVEWRETEDGSDDKAVVTVTVDGERVPLTMRIDEDGRLLELTMMRFGNVGAPSWQLIPYGFSVEEESTFDGITIPTRIRGGWWYGTDRYNLDSGASFLIEQARFHPTGGAIRGRY